MTRAGSRAPRGIAARANDLGIPQPWLKSFSMVSNTTPLAPLTSFGITFEAQLCIVQLYTHLETTTTAASRLCLSYIL